MRDSKRIITTVILLVFLLIPQKAATSQREISDDQPAPATQDSLNLRRVGRGLFEPLWPVFVENDIAFLGSYTDIFALDVTDPTNPSIISSHAVPGYAPMDISVNQGIVYIALGYSGLFIYTFTETEGFDLIGSYIPGGTFWRVIVEDSIAFLASSGVFHILDVSDPRNPVVLDTIDCGGGAWNVEVVDTLCYTVCSKKLVILNISDPAHVEEISSVDMPVLTTSLAVANEIVFLTTERNLFSIDVSDIYNPTFIDTLVITYPPTVEIYDIAIYDEYAYLWNPGLSLHIVDINNPEELQLITTIDDLPGNSSYWGFSLEYPFVFATYGEGLRVIDVSNPEDPLNIGFYDGEFFLRGIEVKDDYAYICDWNSHKLIVADLSEKSFPHEVASAYVRGARDVGLYEDYAYVASESTGLHIFDISNPSEVVLLGNNDTRAVGVAVSYPYAYLATSYHYQGEGLKIFNVEDPDSIVELGFFETPLAKNVFIDQERAYLAASFYGVFIIDVSDPNDPSLYSYIPSYDLAHEVAVYNEYVYIAEGYAGLRVIDISDPDNPRQVDQWLTGYVDALYLDFPYLYLAGTSGGYEGGQCSVFDISQPDSLVLVAYYPVKGIYEVYAEGGYVYVTTSATGLYILSFEQVGIWDDTTDISQLPSGFSLNQNYPNPFNPTTTISFDIPGKQHTKKHTSLIIYDLRGRHVKTLIDSELEPGIHEMIWNGRDEKGQSVSSGIYFYTLQIAGEGYTKKMTLLK